ncbi:MAG: type II toxin-antitoxin system HicB family antitoxin [Clostridia bacterium]|nr:type II toxin-antitoxin system HicB family antitoxin [Clostridia bacterium]
MKNIYTFPAVLHYAEDGISISYPDLPGCLSCSDTTEEATRDAKEALGLHLWGMENDGDFIPEPTPIDSLVLEKNEIPLLVEVFMPSVRARIETRFVKKTLSIPAYMNARAEEVGINFSQVLQEALSTKLDLPLQQG